MFYKSKVKMLQNDTPLIKFPVIPLRYTCCADCSKGDYDANKDMVWCSKYGHWYTGSDGCNNGPDEAGNSTGYTNCGNCVAGGYDASKGMVWCGKYRHWYDTSDGCNSGYSR